MCIVVPATVPSKVELTNGVIGDDLFDLTSSPSRTSLIARRRKTPGSSNVKFEFGAKPWFAMSCLAGQDLRASAEIWLLFWECLRQ